MVFKGRSGFERI